MSRLSDHFTAGSSQLMHWRTVRPEMVTTGTIRFSQFGQRVVRSMRPSRFPPNWELELLFHLSVTAKTGDAMGAARVMLVQRKHSAGPSILRYRQHASDVPIERSCRNRLTRAGWKGDSKLSARLVEIKHGIGRS